MHRQMGFSERQSKEDIKNFSTYNESLDYLAFVQATPNVLAGKNIRLIIDHFKNRRKKGKKNIVMIGAHFVKCGLNPYLCELIKRGLVDLIAVNGAVVIHDVEYALYGKTSEDVADGLLNGTYASANEPLDFINHTLRDNDNDNYGYGYSIGKALSALEGEYVKQSLLYTAFQYDMPLTVHISIGTDINQIHDSFDVAKSAVLSYRDFEVFQEHVNNLAGGMIFNCGSAVLLPEIFLKALTISRNNGIDVSDFLGINLDFNIQYRSNAQIVDRAKSLGGQGYHLVGHHELLIPLLFGSLIQRMKEN